MAKKAAFTHDSAERIARIVRRSESGQSIPPLSRGAGGGGDSGYRILLGKTDASHAKGATGTISIYDGATLGSEADTGENVTAYNRFADVASGKWVHVLEHIRGYELISCEC